MSELDKYECFGVPSHVWVSEEGVAKPERTGATRRNWVFREIALLGAEAMPSPQLETITR